MKLEGNCSKDEDPNGILLQSRKGSGVRLQIVPAQPKTITHLPKRPPVDLAFTDLTYKVREGRKNSESLSIIIYNKPLWINYQHCWRLVPCQSVRAMPPKVLDFAKTLVSLFLLFGNQAMRTCHFIEEFVRLQFVNIFVNVPQGRKLWFLCLFCPKNLEF